MSEKMHDETILRSRPMLPTRFQTLRGLEFFDFLLRSGKFSFELGHFAGVVHLFAGAGQALLDVVDFFVEQLDAFFDFFVHGKAFSYRLSAISVLSWHK